jgi:alpha-L-fucosidase
MKNLLFIVCFLNTALSAQQKIQTDSIREKMQWFADAKLGIFIHWGIYSVHGTDESWAFYNKKVSYSDYMNQINGFTAKNYLPQYWADLVQESGAKYAILTTKHHDGVALWDTKLSDLSIPKKAPAKRDVVTPFFTELKKRNIKIGTYFSVLDWSHPDYTGFMKDSSRYKIVDNPERWQRFVTFFHNQIEEVTTTFKPDLLWLDGDWEHSAEEWKAEQVRRNVLKINPKMIINGRLVGYGDYDTPEQNFPVSRPNFKWWELCMTINNNWGWQPQDTAWKTPFEIITIFADAIGNGGNLLLDIGPKEDGTITPQQVNVLKELGKWTKKHSEAIYGTLVGMPEGHFYGTSTMSKDSTKLYLFLPGKTSTQAIVKGLDNTIKRAYVVGENMEIKPKIVGKISWSSVPGLVYFDIPKAVADEYMTVIALELEKPLKLYRGRGGFSD